MTVFAHAGHWLVQVVYMAPLVALVVILIVNQVRERRARRAAPPDASSASLEGGTGSPPSRLPE